MAEVFQAILFGIVEGITEWLPISSTGHMILLNEFVRMQVREEFWNLFLVVIQLGAVLAVVVLYWNRLFPFDFSALSAGKLAGGADGGRSSKGKPSEGRLSKGKPSKGEPSNRRTSKGRPSAEGRLKERPSKEGGGFLRRDVLRLWGRILIACIPAAVVGLLFDDWLEEHLYRPEVVAAMLILFGIGFLVIERPGVVRKPRVRRPERLSCRDAFLIGLFQLVAAIFPGTSRSGATILGGLMIGISRRAATEFTFFLAVPVMLGASLLKLLRFGFSFTGQELLILGVGMLVAFVVSLMVIRFLISFVRKHDFRPFGWYRIALGVAVLVWFFFAQRP